MKSLICNIKSIMVGRCFVAALLNLLLVFSATAQIQQAWVAHYNNGITSGTNQAVKMALDPLGNIYVTGFSQNSNGNLGYATIKYAPNGQQLWAARYDSSNFPGAMPAAMVLDVSNAVLITGAAALTIKYDSNGNQLWSAPYAGTALAVDTNANVYVVGFSTNFGTVKINPQGSNVWSTTFVEPGVTVSESVLVDDRSNVYVSGLDTYMYVTTGDPTGYGPYGRLTTIKYDANGNQLWRVSSTDYEGQGQTVQVGGAALDSGNNLYLVANFIGTAPYITFKYATAGSVSWMANDPTANGSSLARALTLDNSGSVFITGQDSHYPGFGYGTYKLNSNGAYVWTNIYHGVVAIQSVATSIAMDSNDNSYVTGYSPGTNSLNDIVTIKYGPNGNQIWLQSYGSPGNGNAAGNAIAVDNNGNVYVAGYDTTTAGGTEMVLIKYWPISIQKKSDGSILLQAQGTPGESFDIQASADLQNWLDLGNVIANTNGLMQYTDTNASNFAARFYYTNPQ